MNEGQITALKKSMSNPELIETHISWLLLDDFVYKIKKPVKFSFLDFTTIEKRKFVCDEEVRLNRRLAPDIYVGVVPVIEGEDGRASIGGKGKTIDYAVKMKKLPQEKRMDLLLKGGKVGALHIRKIADIVASFHEKIDVISDSRYGSAEVVKRQIDDLGNFRTAIDEACGFGKKVDFILERSDSFIEKNKKSFEKRQRDGKIKDCHGDLHSANIFILDSEIVIFDCIEFNRDFRFIDVASEIAFMMMDLDAFGREDYSRLFVEQYLSETRDAGLKTMLPLYKCYRANVRAKVAAIDWMQNKSSEAKGRIAKYMLLAERYAKELPGG